MKRKPMLLVGGAILLILATVWIPDVLGVVRATERPLGPPVRVVDFPINRKCVVTVDPLAASKPVIAGIENVVTGFAAPDTAEGVLIRLDPEWLVLRENSEDYWIPTSKVILIRVCE